MSISTSVRSVIVEGQRTARVEFRCTPREGEQLRELSDHLGLTSSDVVRQLVREKHAEVFGPPTPPRKRRRKR